jgi:hypothetical protein
MHFKLTTEKRQNRQNDSVHKRWHFNFKTTTKTPENDGPYTIDGTSGISKQAKNTKKRRN